jgi:hypothetical protein
MKSQATRDTLNKVKAAIRQPFAWPGGYPISIIMQDGSAICPSCARKNWRLIAGSRHGYNGGWEPAGAQVLWEGGNTCAECNTNLDAYPADETEAA